MSVGPYRELLDRFRSEIECVVDRRGGRVTYAIGDPRSPEEIEAWESRSHYRLPPHYRDFLQACDGFEATAFGPRGQAATTLSIAGLRGLESAREKLVFLFDAFARSSRDAGEALPFDAVRARAQYVSFSQDLRLLFDLEFEAQAYIWIIRPDGLTRPGFSKPVFLASSFQQFFFASIECMLAFGTFAYDTFPDYDRLEDF